MPTTNDPPVVNPALLKAESSRFVKLYAPTTSWGNIISMNLGYPGLRGYWPMSSIDENEAVYDLSGQGRTLTDH